VKDKMKKIDWIKTSMIATFALLLVGFVTYLVSIRQQLWFVLVSPDAVSVCQEGYLGEHSEANRRFELKQRSVLVSPLVDEGKVDSQ